MMVQVYDLSYVRCILHASSGQGTHTHTTTNNKTPQTLPEKNLKAKTGWRSSLYFLQKCRKKALAWWHLEIPHQREKQKDVKKCKL
jgi:hypothetical protein